jgi:hypothetical protein
MNSKKSNPDAGAPEYQPNPQETAALDRAVAGKSTPRVKVQNGAKVAVLPDHPDELIGYAMLMEAVGTADFDFVLGLLRQLVNVSSKGPAADESALNFMLSVVKGIKPRDQLEAMLATQMAAVHELMLTYARRLAHTETIPQQDSAERALNKLARTFASQMEALKRYRTGGEQKVTVQHVSVSEGGQAIVGNVTHAAREAAPALASPQQAPMVLIGEPDREPLLLENNPGRRRRKK